MINHRSLAIEITIYIINKYRTTNPQSSEKFKKKNDLRFRETFLWRALSSLETLAFSFMVGGLWTRVAGESAKTRRPQGNRTKKSAGRSKRSFPHSPLSQSSLLPFLPLSEWEVNTFWTVQIMELVYRFGFVCFQFQNSISGLVLVCSLYRKKNWRNLCLTISLSFT